MKNVQLLFGNSRLGVMLTLGFASGLPLALSGSTLQAWLASTSVDISTIGLFSLVGLPYTLKFLWSPVMDRFVPPFLGRRRGWMLVTQLLLMLLIAGAGLVSPEHALVVLGMIALGIAFASASQDIAVDAYRTDLLHAEERGLGAALSVAGYRVAMLVSGGLALIIADHAGWHATYWLLSLLLLAGVATSVFGPEPTWQPAPPRNMEQAVLKPFREFLSRERALVLLVFIVLYKLGDAFAGTLTTAFLLRGLGFSLTDVGVINKWMGLSATIVGGLGGGALMFRYGLYRCLLWFGILQALTNLGFMLLAAAGQSYIGMVLVIAAENLAGGMGTAAFVALLIALCDHRYSATQFALLSALSAVGRVFIGPPAGLLVEAAGWTHFFLVTFVVALPGLALLIVLRPVIEACDRRGAGI